MKQNMDMCNGPLFKKIWIFTIPVMLSGVLQLLFNAADMIVVGNAVGDKALAAVGATNTLSSLLVNLFLGLSVGGGVIVAQAFGAKNSNMLSRAVHTSVALSIVCGVIVAVIGYFVSPGILRLLKTPDDIIDQSVLYIRIYFAGMPAISLYNYGSAILRSLGDTKRPMIYITAAGVINIALNLVFVLVVKIGVAGVALGTVISQAFAGVLILFTLSKNEFGFEFKFKNIKIFKKELTTILRIGVPAGIQSAFFSISNMIIQSSVNSLGTVAVAGHSAASNIESIEFTTFNSFGTTAVAVAGQNIGAGKYERMKTIVNNFLVSIVLTCIVLSGLLLIFGRFLLGFYTKDTAVIDIGYTHFVWCDALYFLCGIMEIYTAIQKGMGRAIVPTIITLIGTCAVRIIWIYTVFYPFFPTRIEAIYVVYPISWLVLSVAHCISYNRFYKKELKRINNLKSVRKHVSTN